MPSLVVSMAPSEFRMRLSTAKASASQLRASSIACSAEIDQGWYRSSSGISLARYSGSASPEYSSGLVNPAMEQAAATMALIEAADRSVVLAEPLDLFL